MAITGDSLKVVQEERWSADLRVYSPRNDSDAGGVRSGIG